MKRDWTVTLSRRIIVTVLAGALILLLLEVALGIQVPEEVAIFFLIPAYAAMIRFIVLWFQTFIHVLKHAKGRSQVWWALAHVFFGPMASDLYYEGCTVTTETTEDAQQKLSR